MRCTLVLALSLIPASAFALSPGWGVNSATADLKGPVEVPLLRGPTTAELPTVGVKLPQKDKKQPDDYEFAVVDMAANVSAISKGLADGMGYKTHKGSIAGKEVDWTVIPVLKIGDLTLTNVKMQVLPSVGAGAAAISLGAATLPLGTALLPSKGLVRFVPTAQADQLVTDTGAVVPGTRIKAQVWKEHGTKKVGNGLSFSVPGTLLGVDGLVRIRTGNPSTTVVVAPEGPKVVRPAGIPTEFGEGTLAGLPIGPTWVGTDESRVEPTGKVIGMVGYDVLYGMDIAIDPAKNELSFRPTATVLASNPTKPIYDAGKEQFDYGTQKAADDAAKKKGGTGASGGGGGGTERPVDPTPAPAPAAATAPTTSAKAPSPHGDKGDAAKVGLHSGWAQAMWDAGRWDESVAESKVAADPAIAGDQCKPYFDLGTRLLQTGHPADAIAPLQQAATLWDRWDTQPFETKQKVKAKHKVDANVFTVSQPSDCFTAWSWLAGAYVATNQIDLAADVYAKHTDLDGRLPEAYGFGLTMQGKGAEANGPLRRSINMGMRDDQILRAGLALANAQAHRDIVADESDRLAVVEGDDTLVAQLTLVEAARVNGGDAGALATAKTLSETYPTSAAASLLYAREIKRSGGDTATVLGTATSNLERLEKREVNSVNPTLLVGFAKALASDADGAKAAFELARKDGGDRWRDYWVSLALADAVTGDYEGTQAAELGLLAHDPFTPIPGVALMPPPPPPPPVAPPPPPEPPPPPPAPPKKGKHGG